MFRRSVLVVAVALVATVSTPLPALERIYVTRHADKIDSWLPAPDTGAFWPLSAQGVARSEALADMLAGAGIVAAYTSRTTRALHTAFPLSRRTGATVVVEGSTVDRAKMAGFLKQLEVAHAEDDAVLIVGHSNTVPGLLVELGATPECHDRLGIRDGPGGLLVEGHQGLWLVELDVEGCDRITRAEVRIPSTGSALRPA